MLLLKYVCWAKKKEKMFKNSIKSQVQVSWTNFAIYKLDIERITYRSSLQWWWYSLPSIRQNYMSSKVLSVCIRYNSRINFHSHDMFIFFFNEHNFSVLNIQHQFLSLSLLNNNLIEGKNIFLLLKWWH